MGIVRIEQDDLTFDLSDAQTRKERLDAKMWVTRALKPQCYTISLDHISEPAIWTVWKSATGRWFGINDRDNRMLDAASLRGAKFDLRMGYFV